MENPGGDPHNEIKFIVVSSIQPVIKFYKMPNERNNTMTIDQLRYVVEIAKVASINMAANNLFISRPVLSAAVSKLENELGQEIFVRSPKGVHLTPFGKLFLDHIKPLILQLEQLQSFSVQKREQIARTFSVVSSGFPLVSSILCNMTQHFSDLNITVQHFEQYEVEIPTYVADHIASIGVIRIWDCYSEPLRRQFEIQRLRFYPLAELEVGITIGQGHPLYKQQSDYITRKQLESYPFVGYVSLDTGPYANIFRQLQINPPKKKFVTTSRAALYEVMAQTNAFTLNSIYPERALDTYMDAKKQTLRTLRLENCQIKSIIGWLMRQDHIPNELDQFFLKELQKYFV